MTVEEAIALVEQLLERGRLTRVQEIVFRYAWEGKTYLEIAREVTYDPGHIKDVGSQLWRSLSEVLDEKVTKNNLHGVLKRTTQQQNSTNTSPTFTPHIDWGEAIDVSRFFTEGTTVFNGIGNLIEQQFQRLYDLEKQVMYWLAIHRETVSVTELETDLTPAVSKSKLMQVIESLSWRTLIENNTAGFTQQPVVMEYVTDCLIEQICQEIVTESPRYLLSHALIKAQAKDYIRDTQIHLIVRPILDQLQVTLGSNRQLEHKLGILINKLQDEKLHLQGNREWGVGSGNNGDKVNNQCSMPNVQCLDPVGYCGGNLLNLLAQLESDLTGYDFSHLNIRQADLRSLNLHQVNFTQTTFRECAFAATFGGITSVVFSADGHHLAISDTNGGIYIWDASNGKELFIYKEHNSWIWCLMYQLAPLMHRLAPLMHRLASLMYWLASLMYWLASLIKKFLVNPKQNLVVPPPPINDLEKAALPFLSLGDKFLPAFL